MSNIQGNVKHLKQLSNHVATHLHTRKKLAHYVFFKRVHNAIRKRLYSLTNLPIEVIHIVMQYIDYIIHAKYLIYHEKIFKRSQMILCIYGMYHYTKYSFDCKILISPLQEYNVVLESIGEKTKSPSVYYNILSRYEFMSEYLKDKLQVSKKPETEERLVKYVMTCVFQICYAIRTQINKELSFG